MNTIGFNFIDLGILLVFLYFIRSGINKGFYALFFESASFFLGILTGLLFYAPLGGFLSYQFEFSRSLAKVIAFTLCWLAVELILPAITAQLYHRVPSMWLESKWNKVFGPLPALLEAYILCVFMLSLSLAFPFSPLYKDNVFSSRLGEPMIKLASSVEYVMAGVFGEPERESLAYMTVGRTDTETIPLGFKTDDYYSVPNMERQMLELINGERSKINLKPLIMDQSLVEISRAHGADMLSNGYFSHLSLAGLTVSDRAYDAGISLRKIAENLAFAPNVSLAHSGLMKSTYHRSNILSNEFKRVGVGVQNAGSRGIIWVQTFAD